MKNFEKYNRYDSFVLDNRTWPSNTITQAPIWTSVDLRDGNQALPVPMTVEKKLLMFEHLVKLGLKQIEVGFPFASETDYNFVRMLIEGDYVPDDVTIFVLSSCSRDCIDKSFESLKGTKKAGIQIYSLCSPAQREYVIKMSKEELIQYTADAAKYTRECTEKYPQTEFFLGYGVESFTITEIELSLAICNSVVQAFNPTAEHKCFINLPSTMEVAMPNQFADQVEYIHKNLVMRENVILSVHTHNDRGTGVAAAELALLAGAQRIEGTLFGNGERTGNMDLVTIALNLYTTGIDPKLDFSNIKESIDLYEKCTGLDVHVRHPYAGKQVFTAYSGGHQDAIRKGLINREKSNEEKWLVPYIPIDPADLGRNMDSIIQINSQSGKGGVLYVLEKALNITLPRQIQTEFGKHIKHISDKKSQLLSSDKVLEIFFEKYRFDSQLCQVNKIELEENKNIVNINVCWRGEELKLRTPRGEVINFCFEEIKKRYKLNNLKMVQHINEQDCNGRYYTYIQVQDGNKSSYNAFVWGLDENKTQLLALFSAIELILAVMEELFKTG